MGHIDESFSLGLRIIVSLVYVICENAAMVSNTMDEDSGAIHLLTAMYSEELAEVTAMKTKSSVAAAPPLPNNATYTFI